MVKCRTTRKELIWVVQKDENVSATATATVFGPQWYNYTTQVDRTGLTGAVVNAFDIGYTQENSYLNSMVSSPLSLTAGNNTAGGIWASNPATWSTSNLGTASTVALYDLGVNPTVIAKLQLNGQ